MAIVKSNVNVKIDARVKEFATCILNNMGIDQTTAIDMFYRQVIAERGLPFQPSMRRRDYGERLLEKIKHRDKPGIVLEADENGHAYIDKDKYPELYDWAVNG